MQTPTPPRSPSSSGRPSSSPWCQVLDAGLPACWPPLISARRLLPGRVTCIACSRPSAGSSAFWPQNWDKESFLGMFQLLYLPSGRASALEIEGGKQFCPHVIGKIPAPAWL